MKIIFMGTSDFAVPILQKIINSSNHDVVAIFTQLPKPQGRGLKIKFSPVYITALENNIPVYTPDNLSNDLILKIIDLIIADIIVVVSYGLILPLKILKSKKYGCVNVHPSRLPKYRGAAPLHRVIMAGESQTGVSIIQMDEGLDSGCILLESSFNISDRITLSLLCQQCSDIGSNLLLDVLNNIDTLPKIPQDCSKVTYAPKIKKLEGRINWSESSYTIDCKIRALNPWPGTFCFYKNNLIKILEAIYSNTNSIYSPGTIISDNLFIACGTGVLKINKLQLSGKKILSTYEFLLGNKIVLGTCLN